MRMVLRGVRIGNAGYSGPDSFQYMVQATGPNATPATTESLAATVSISTTAAPAPQVAALRRYGIHWQPTRIVVTFTEPMNATSVESLANYAIVTGQRFHRKIVHIVAAQYDAMAQSVTLTPARRLNVHFRRTLEINAHGPTGASSGAGVFLDGAGNGTPGTDYVKTFGFESLVRPRDRDSSLLGQS
jgi:hypothetical protein